MDEVTAPGAHALMDASRPPTIRSGDATGETRKKPMAAEPDDLDAATFAHVTALLGAGRARELILILGTLVVELHGAGDAFLACPDGLASIHRLKSEAGLMGFARLGRACEAIDGAAPGAALAADAMPSLRMALASALPIVARLSDPDQGRPANDAAPRRAAPAFGG
ncbi:hypothetical protein ASF52_05940 [Methylobacterium sp. Leaf112]|nr:hypothetical protein ASF52_05940 [Methylobacterium sp. Leaf112]